MVDTFDYGYKATLFPLTTSGEDRATSIFFAVLNLVHPFRNTLLKTINRSAYKSGSDFTATLHPSFGGNYSAKDIPDGLICLNQKETWKALVEVKVKGQDLSIGQLDNYLKRVKEHKLSALITVSNELCTNPTSPPIRLKSANKSLRKLDHFHWSWRYILFLARTLLANHKFESQIEAQLLGQFVSFLEHEKSGITGFNAMPIGWGEFTNKLRDGGQPDQEKSEEIVGNWFQETSELALILADSTGKHVVEIIETQSAERRVEAAVQLIKDQGDLCVEFKLENHNYPLTVCLDIDGRRLQFSTKHDLPSTAKKPCTRIEHFLKNFYQDEEKDEWGGHKNVRLFAHWPRSKQPTDMTMFDAIQHVHDDELKNSKFIMNDKDNIKCLEIYYTPSKVSQKIASRTQVINLLEEEIVFFTNNYVIL